MFFSWYINTYVYFCSVIRSVSKTLYTYSVVGRGTQHFFHEEEDVSTDGTEEEMLSTLTSHWINVLSHSNILMGQQKDVSNARR